MKTLGWRPNVAKSKLKKKKKSQAGKKPTRPSTGEGINKEILLSDEKEQTTDSLNNMDKSQKQHVEKKKLK